MFFGVVLGRGKQAFLVLLQRKRSNSTESRVCCWFTKCGDLYISYCRNFSKLLFLL